jgi:hypothetical protein
MRLIEQKSDAIAILLGGGIAATLDMSYACVRNAGFDRAPMWTMQSVASGWLGEAAFQGGAGAALLGLVSHTAILLVAAALYVQAGRRLAPLRTHSFICGALFGVLVYLFMNFVVLRLSAFPFTLHYTMSRLLEGFGSHAVFVGIPIALASRLARPVDLPAVA